MFKNRDFEIAYNHLQLSIEESENSTKEVLEILNSLLKEKNRDEKLVKNLENAIEKLQFQDIFAQRLKKVQNFLKEIDKKIDSKKDENKLNEFAWENEVDQNDVDDILKSYGL